MLLSHLLRRGRPQGANGAQSANAVIRWVIRRTKKDPAFQGGAVEQGSPI
jgi:hypothetical protein